MSQALKERLKNIVILILILIGALQVGILWSYQNHGAPINFIMSFFSSPPVSGEYTREKLFVPDRLILSSGDIYYWVVGRNSSYYNELWREAQKGLGKIISKNVGLKLSNESWGDITAKRGFILDFGYSLKPDLLKWFLGINGKTRDLPEICKVMVKPDLLDESSNIYYIYTADGRVYVSDPIIYERSKSLKDILKHFYEDDGKNYRSLVTFKSANVVIGRNVPDVLYATASYGKYYNYSVKLPADKNNDELETALFGSEKNRYDMSEDSSGTKQFSSGNNIYRYYRNGYMTYQYTDSSVSSDKGDIGEALVNAYNLINEFKLLSGSLAEFYLTSANETSDGVYSFTFDYKLNGLPVKINLNANSADGKSLINAVKIQADSKRVLSCTAILRNFVQGAEGNYNDQFFDLLRKTDYAFKSMKIQDMHFGYSIHAEDNIALKPSILVDVKDKPTVQIEMSEKGE